MRLEKPLRSGKGGKRIDLSDLRHVLRDERQWSAIGVVVAPTDGSPHWRIETDDSEASVDILVEVVIQPDEIPVTARLAGGLWCVPAIGEEVALIIPAGRVDFMPIVLAILSSNTVPNGGGQGPTPTQIVIARGKVLIHDGSGGAAPLPTLSEFNNHTHTSATSGSPTSTPISPATGTTVFEAK